jgi:DNA mismatch repair protein MutS
MGARMLRSMMERPLINIDRINARLDAVEELSNHMMDREELREYLTLVYDLERLLMRISYGSANPRDLLAFRTSLSALPAIRTLLLSFSSSLMQELAKELDPMEDLYQLLMDELDDDPPVSVHDGDIIRLGFSEEVDMLRKAKTEGKSWLAGLEERERERTGIKTLKVKYNKVFGYYLEVSNSYKDMVPEDYIRKQTLANAERFYTPELKELENTILGSEDKLNHLENVMFTELVRLLSDNVSRIQKTAKAIAACDVLCSLSYVAQKQGYVRPVMNTEGRIHIEEGRHPVVEMMIPSGSFVSNDTVLDDLDNRIAIITGPNMAGKSTYMRQTALIVLMAQIGSFVPAGRAEIGIVDRIFTRVGASDDLASGQSTFMVEMNEVANILKNATSKSLIILDEIGRGTSTFDGLSIAWAVVEHIADASILGAKTLFATHYHELTELEGRLAGVHNYCIAVKENGDDIVFLRKIITGGADRSYGIEVARLAGVPQSVIDRSKEIAERLSDDDIRNRMRDLSGDTEEKPVKAKPKKKEKKNDQIEGQMSLFDSFGTIDTQKEELLQSIADLDLNHMSPMDAMNRLYELQGKVRELE